MATLFFEILPQIYHNFGDIIELLYKRGDFVDFREIHITQPSQLKYRNECVSIRTNDQLIDRIPLSEINTIVVDSPQVIFSERFLLGCQEKHVNLILTDKRHQPISMVTKPRVYDQMSWSDSIKSLVWQVVVRAKLQHQAMLLSYLNLPSFTLPDFGVKITDSIEALSAKTTFRQLFGDDFVRDRDLHDVNQVLNYGYSLLAHYLTTEIVSHGYLPALGVHHHSNDNDCNLAWDLVEPFRFVIDKYGFDHQHQSMNVLMRSNLIDLLNIGITFNGQHYETLSSCLDDYVALVLRTLSSGNLHDFKIGVGEDVMDAVIDHV